jgi:hypothetical protein
MCLKITDFLFQDFSLDHEEGRMRLAAHSMVRNLTAGMAMITCRDHLLQSIKVRKNTSLSAQPDGRHGHDHLPRPPAPVHQGEKEF